MESVRNEIPQKYKLAKFMNSSRYVCLHVECTSRDPATPNSYSQLGISKHYETFHSKPEDLSHSCRQCNATFALKMMLRVHVIKEHDKTFQCSFCKMTFANKRDVQSHQLTHQKTAYEEKRYKCTLCDFKSNYSRCIQTHRRLKHDMKEEHKKHVCTVCNKSYLYKYRLYAHSATHDNIKRYICRVCNHEYKSDKGLRLHLMKKHVKYVCEICKKEFSSPRGLKMHQRESHDLIVGLKDVPSTSIIALGANTGVSKVKKEVGASEVRTAFFYVCKKCKEEFSSPPELKVHDQQFHLSLVDLKDESPKKALVKSAFTDAVIAKSKIEQEICVNSTLTEVENEATPQVRPNGDEYHALGKGIKAAITERKLAWKCDTLNKIKLNCPSSSCEFQTYQFGDLILHLDKLHSE